MFVMAKEPIPDVSAEDVKEFFADKNTEKDLADVFAITSNKYWWVADNVYDYEEGTPEHKIACEIADAWGALMDEYEKRILEILATEGVIIPKTGRIKVLACFMERYGYENRNGWWVKTRG